MLLWITLISAPVLPLNSITSFSKVLPNHHYHEYYNLLWILGFVCIPLAGWLADTKFGNYEIFKAGAVLTFLATAVGSITIIILFSAIKKP